MTTSKHYFDATGKHVDSITTGFITKYETPEYTSVDNDTPVYLNPIILRDGVIVEQVQKVSMAQARNALIEKDLIEKVQATLDGIKDDKERAKAKAWWEYATTVERSHPTVKALIQVLELSEAEVDELFLLASQQ